MTMMLRVVLMVFSATFFVAVIRMVARDRLQLKYSLLWLLMSVLLMLMSGVFTSCTLGGSDCASTGEPSRGYTTKR
jgi:O-antigen/teichoic acid export membrane protein